MAILGTASVLLAASGSVSAQVISNVVATGVTSGSAVISWTTDQPASSLVNYGVTTSYGSASSLNTILTTKHSVALSGLSANTLYNFEVVSSNSASTTTTSANYVFATVGLSPVVSGINVINITGISATINWTTDQPASSEVNYGLTTAYGSASPAGSTMSTAHSITVTGLTPATTYNFDVVSGSTSSANQTFTTAAASATAPNVGAITLTGITDSSATLAWTTDVAATTLVAYGSNTALGQVTPIQSTLTTSHGAVLSGLSRGTTYYVVAESTGGNGTTGYSPVYTFTTTGPASLVPAISNVATSSLTGTSATITWTTDQPSTTQVNYGTTTSYGASSTLDATLTTSHSVTLTGLTPDTQYDFQLVSASTTGTATFGADMTGITVWAWGDSLTQGGQDGTQNTYPRYLATDLGTTVNNEGVDGITSTQIAQMMLATPASFTAGNCHVIWSGGNNPDQVSTVLSDIASMVAALDTSCFLILGDINDGWTVAGSPTYNLIVSTNQSLATLYPNNYLNIRELLVQAYNPALPLDVASYGFDITPESLQSVEPYGSITSGALDSKSCAIGVSNGTFGGGSVIIVDAETILINAVSADQLSITDCTRGYNGTVAASHQANSTYSIVDAIHLGANGYAFVAQQVAAWFAAQMPLNFTTATNVGTSNPAIGTPTVSNITSTSAVVMWTTDQSTTSLVNYGLTTNYGIASTPNPALTTAHAVTLTGLTPNTVYNFEVISANATGGSSTSSNLTFTTSAVAVAPVISGVGTANLTSTSATINWSTDQPTTAQVSYGLTTNYGTLSQTTTALSTSQSITLTGLLPNTTYDYQVVAANASGTSSTSANFTFTTAAAVTPTPTPGATAPYVGYVAFWSVTDTGITISWSTDQSSSTVVAYGTTPALGQTYTAPDSTLTVSHGVVLTGLTPGTTYYFQAQSTGVNGATGSSTTYTFTTSGTAPIVASPGFSLSSTAATVADGASGTSTVTITPSNGFSSSVTLTTANWPAGITGTFGTSSGASATLTINVGATVTPGSYLLTVNGTSGTLSQTTTLLLNVIQAAPTPTPTPTLGATASFVGTDTTTQGTWTGTYGSNGFVIAGDTSNLPSYAALDLSSDLTYTWVPLAPDVRAVQTASGASSRLAATYYTNSAAFNIPLDLNDGALHQVAIYMLDWDTSSRTQTITITESATGKVLDSRNFSGFHNGAYGVWNISGNVTINLSAPFGSAVVSAFFFDPASGATQTPSFTLSATAAAVKTGATGTSTVTVTPVGGFNSAVTLTAANWPAGITGTFGTNPANATSVATISVGANVAPGAYSLSVTGISGSFLANTTISLTVKAASTGPAATASFVGLDKATQGTWTGSYGADGYLISNGPSIIPTYATVSFITTVNYTWAGLTTDPRAPQASAGGTARIASAYTQTPGQQFAINLGINDGNTHKISLYALDWDTSSRVETVTILDAVTNTVLDMETLSGFHNGEYASWNINGSVIIQIAPTGYFSPAMSAIFFN